MIRRVCLAAAAILAAAAAAPAQDSPPDAIALGGVDVAFLGEIHDNPAHHAAQVGWVAQLAPKALVFEMLTPAQALRIGPDRSDAAALNAATGWEARGWPDFALYHPIFLAAPDAAIFGGGVPPDDARRAVSKGAATVIGDAAGLFGLDQALPAAELSARVAGQAAAHCDALPADLLPGMVEAQRLRDAALARAAIAALAETGGPVAVITGNGHARTDWGAPALLARAQPGLATLSIGQFEAPPDVVAGAVPHDSWTSAAAPDRADPCAVFR